MPPNNPRKFKRRKMWLVVPESRVNYWYASDLHDGKELAVKEQVDLMADLPGTRWKVIAVWVDRVGARTGKKQEGEK